MNSVCLRDKEPGTNFNWSIWTGPMPHFLHSSLKTTCFGGESKSFQAKMNLYILSGFQVQYNYK